MGLLHLNGVEKGQRRVFPNPGLGYRRKPCGVAKTTHKPKTSFAEGAAVTEGLAKPASPGCAWGSQGRLHRGQAAHVPRRSHTELPRDPARSLVGVHPERTENRDSNQCVRARAHGRRVCITYSAQTVETVPPAIRRRSARASTTGSASAAGRSADPGHSAHGR